MKKSRFFAGALVVLALSLSLAGCGAKGEARTYTVTLSEVDSAPQYSSTVEMLEEIRPTVVDVTAYFETGASAGSGVIISGSKAEGAIRTKGTSLSQTTTLSRTARVLRWTF